MLKDTRNLIFNTTQAIRRLLEEEFALQLEGTFDIHPDGRVADQPGPQLTPAERLVRQRIVEAIQHRRAVGEAAVESVRGFQAEAVFTFLNRLAALKMMEARGLVLPCVSQGDQSQGFKEFSGLAPGLIELPDKGYRLYLECIFDEIGREVGVLFDRTDAASQLWPRRKALEAALEKLNNPELAGVWTDDETIGWIYQYYNDPAERKKMRDESAAPRNSRELAVRNQFFTPRYVVEFLTDNTLGRIWYEMSGGATSLKEKCRYLVRRPNEIFLGPASEIRDQHQGSASPTDSPSTLNPDAAPCPPVPNPDAEACTLSQEDLLKQPVHIPHRPLKDPRTILMLDPACGSMHFGLYAFDLFEVIYHETWALEEKLGADALSRPPGMKSLHDTYAGKDAFLKDVPHLIIEHNIHGIDIDPRAAQIAGLALWLRAQKSWQRMGLKPTERPAIKRSNIVCAEPMPGEKELLREFVEREFPAAERAVCLRLLEAIFDKMQLAGEAGSLLKIEEEIRSAIEDARDAWQKLTTRPPELFTTTELNQLSTAPELTGLEQAVSSLTTDHRHLTTAFWERIEERIYAALRDYAEQAENGGGFQRRLFAEDAARGFAFIDVCRKRYDVALMNPPFGNASKESKRYLARSYPITKSELYAAFVERGLGLISDGALGAITSRSGFFQSSFEKWRTQILLPVAPPFAVADLGAGVLDGAMVETVAYCLPKGEGRRSAFIRLGRDSQKGTTLLSAIESLRDGAIGESIYEVNPHSFSAIPSTPFAYWIPRSIQKMFVDFPRYEEAGRSVKQGLVTSGDFRFVRAYWEIESSCIGRQQSDALQGRNWFSYPKGGEFSPFYADIPLVVNWLNDGAE
ncbi:MAG: SAM-dependent methyltransferase, partial [bacterium]|nr:SAM-dependent methyltransferase [bacterium]